MRDVHVSYGAAPRAQAKLVFAIDLARRLSARLYVWIEEDPDANALLRRLRGVNPSEHEFVCVKNQVQAMLTGADSKTQLSFCGGDPHQAVRNRDSIVIGEAYATRRPSFLSVDTKGESSLGARGCKAICVPFADKESSFQAASLAVPLAVSLGMSVLLYHTTWGEPGLPNDAPAERHMNDGSSRMLSRIRNLADQAGVQHETVLEVEASIAGGTVRAALNGRCALIVMARGKRIGYGSHVDQILERSVVPVMVIGRSHAS